MDFSLLPRVSHLLRGATVALVGVLVTSCGGAAPEPGGERTTSETGSSSAPELALRQVGRFDRPVRVLEVPGTDLVAVVEQGGRVVVASGMTCRGAGRCPGGPATTGDVVLDLRGKVATGTEQGLLGMAFHPDWPTDDRIFVDYTGVDGTTHVEAWSLPAPTAHATREVELLRIRQPYANHNGGHLVFGPDGLLYVGTGDGGDAGDPEDRAQEGDDLLGKLLRIDVDGGGERGYAIPDGNLQDGASEVWAVGLRNPWRFAFDAKTGDLWIGDVGQDTWEEVDALPAARLASGDTPNFGWRLREGFESFEADGRHGPGTIEPPVLAYGRDDGCSVTGGMVYRGDAVPALDGWYVFADFCGERLRLMRADGVPGVRHRAGDLAWVDSARAERVVSIDQVQGGELLVVSLDGSISQVVER